ncbi:MAG: ABC transporter substrate-binding protein [Oscillospiraceae bacterium]|nr:ABC transporter substrate-binding protein [Oscillospiraceae bacterium]
MGRKGASKLIAISVALAMALTLASCGGVTYDENQPPLVVSTGDFNEKFSPFTGESAYDMDIVDMVLGPSLISNDRQGEMVYKGIGGETRAYNGTDYSYKGLADGAVDYDKDKDVTKYTLTLRKGVKFSDGVEMTADDVIFTYYVLLDPTYIGINTLNTVKIQGLEEYQSGYANAFDDFKVITDAIEAAGPEGDGTGSSVYTQQEYGAFWAGYLSSLRISCQAVVDYCVGPLAGYIEMLGFDPAAVSSNAGMAIAYSMMLWGFADMDDDDVLISPAGSEFDLKGSFPTLDDFGLAVLTEYGGSFEDASDEGEFDVPGSEDYHTFLANYIGEMIKANPDKVKRSVTNISGITKTDKYSLEVMVDGFDTSAVYKLFGMQAAPMHYYGDKDKYDYAKDRFGFDYGDLGFVKETEKTPMGAGPYKFVKCENKVAYLTANTDYWKGAPKVRDLQFKVGSEDDNIPGIQTGTIDIANLSFNRDRFDEIQKINPNGELTGDIITYIGVRNLGYGYVGINSKGVSVGDERGSDASKNLRKGLATIISVYRDLTTNTYYGNTAEVINYSMSRVSWAAPQRTDPGYEEAFSKDVNGNAIYNPSMTEEQRYKAAEQAALGFLEKAGYTVENGKVTAAPAGAKLTYTAWIPGDGKGDHPSFLLLTKTAESFSNIGLTLNINDLAASATSQLWDALRSESAEIWCAAWASSIDPDITQLYNGDPVRNNQQSSARNPVGIADAELDRLILETRRTPDMAARKQLFMECFKILLDWGVEVPVYQRDNIYIYSTERLKIETLAGDMTPFYQWGQEVELIEVR